MSDVASGSETHVGWRAKIGLVIPSNNTVIEPELYAMRPHGVSIHSSRILSFGSSPEAILKMERSSERAIAELRIGGMDVVAYACLATSLVKGRAWTQDFAERMGRQAGVKLITAAEATLSALSALRAKRIAVCVAYPTALIELLPRFFASHGFDIVRTRALEVPDSTELWRVSPEQISALGRSAAASGDTLCFLGTDIPTAGLIEKMEAELDMPVVATNQAILYESLAICGIVDPIPGFGTLLRRARGQHR